MSSRSKIGHYDIVSELGRGGMGVVYKGFEPQLNRHVAIKTLSESLANDPTVVERFLREARSMAQLNDPHIIQIFLVGEDQGQPYFAMEFVEGESLSQKLKRESRLDPAEASRILLQVAQGLAMAHDRGVIHRDIKPGNLMITARGHVKVADFGIALASHDTGKKLTGTGEFVGTPGYLSPEVCLGKPVDQRSDIFALGIVFFEMLTGRMPFTDHSPLGMMLEVVRAEIPDVRTLNDSVDPRLVAILNKMVCKDPEQRYQDCHNLIADLIAAGASTLAPITPSKPLSNPAIGTVVNTPTPAELKRVAALEAAVASEPKPTPISQPQMPLPPAPPAAPAAAAAAPVRPQVQARPAVANAPKKAPSLLPVAAALLVLIGAAGAGAYAFRDRLGGLLPGSTEVAAPSTAATTTDPQPATTTAAVSEPATSAPASTPASTAGSAAVVDAPATPVASSNTGDSSVATLTETTPPATPVPAEAPPPAVTPAEAPSVAEQGSRDIASAPRSSGDGQAAAIASRIGELREARREARQAQAEAEAPVQVAKAAPAPAPSAPAYAGPPRVVVMSFGDETVASVAEAEVEARLAEAGVDLLDEELESGLAQFERQTEPDLPRLMAALARARGARTLIAVRVIPEGSQVLTYYGQASTVYNARIVINAYDLQQKRKLGSGWDASLMFSNLNAADNTREAMAPLLGRIVQALETRSGRG